MLSDFRRHLSGYDSLSQEGSSRELAKEDDEDSENVLKVYFIRLMTYKILKQLMVFF